MNILFVNMSIDLVLGGGTAERTCQLVKSLQKLPETNVKVLSTTAGLHGGLPMDSEQCILLPCWNARWYFPAPYFLKVYKALKWADVVIIMGHWTFINAMVYFINKLVKRPYVFCPAGALHVFGRSWFIKRVYSAVIGSSILQHADRIVAIPNDEKEYFCTLGVARNRIAVIPNGIEIEDFSYSNNQMFKAKYAMGDAPFLLFMGRLNEIKGPDILLQAFCSIAAQFPYLHLVIAGPDGGMELQLKQFIKNQRMKSRVHFIGYVSGKEKSEVYHAADLLVVPSRLEAMSIVALEAAVCGTAVVMSNQCGFSELVEAGGAVEVNVNVDHMADALVELLSDTGKVQKMGQDAKDFICNYYTWDIAAKKHRQLCEELMTHYNKQCDSE